MNQGTEITLEQVEEFMQMLTGGDLSDGMRMPDQPQLTDRQAFSVVYYLQERLHLVPDNFEQCEFCKGIFDVDCSGHYIDTEDSPADYGGWYDSIGVTQEMIVATGGVHVCSRGCDVAFWREKFPEWASQ